MNTEKQLREFLKKCEEGSVCPAPEGITRAEYCAICGLDEAIKWVLED